MVLLKVVVFLFKVIQIQVQYIVYMLLEQSTDFLFYVTRNKSSHDKFSCINHQACMVTNEQELQIGVTGICAIQWYAMLSENIPNCPALLDNLPIIHYMLVKINYQALPTTEFKLLVLGSSILPNHSRHNTMPLSCFLSSFAFGLNTPFMVIAVSWFACTKFSDIPKTFENSIDIK
jgi:hypothetical protein